MIGLIAQDSTGGAGGIAGMLVPLVLMGGLFYFLMIRPQRSRVRSQKLLLDSLEVGDEVMTAGGIFGTIREIEDDTDTLTVEIAPGTSIRMLRRGVAQKLVEDEGYDEEAPDEEADQTP